MCVCVCVREKKDGMGLEGRELLRHRRSSSWKSGKGIRATSIGFYWRDRALMRIYLKLVDSKGSYFGGLTEEMKR